MYNYLLFLLLKGSRYMVGTTGSIAALAVDKISLNHALVVYKLVKIK